MKFRKKPVVIEAHRIGDNGWPDSIWAGVNANQIVLHLGRDSNKRVTGHVDIHTMEGTMRGDVGDYIIRGVKGEFYPCKPDIFAATYEAVEAEAARQETGPEHVCGLSGYNGMIDPPCPACEWYRLKREAARQETGE